ncbi:hypothetical protein BST86_07280 [Nonlabens agnitus]|uniref:Uncharacterized protein n=2 Tax=Nonlabens agnitus TaxID=870484 RepID=A0A2S9WTW4_9FLAO|nr:hypothetical protein BST86_07280 [Nonlabens agnitus]
MTFKIFHTLGQQMHMVEKTRSGSIETINGMNELDSGLYLIQVYQNDLLTSIKLNLTDFSMKNLKTLLFVSAMLFTGSLYAQESAPPDFETDVDDVSMAPIPGIAIAAAVALVIGFKAAQRED